MKKIFSKKQLAAKILESNPDIFIPSESLLEDLTVIYRIRKIANKIQKNVEYDENLLKNLVITANNVFGQNAETLYSIIMDEDEMQVIYSTIARF